jgi:ribonuclease P protein component
MQRLQTRAQFQAVLAGATVARTAHFALHRCTLDAPAGAESLFGSARDVWVGAMVPKRWARRAVTRNAIKRQIYTVSALAEASLAACRARGASARRFRPQAIRERHLGQAQGGRARRTPATAPAGPSGAS